VCHCGKQTTSFCKQKNRRFSSSFFLDKFRLSDYLRAFVVSCNTSQIPAILSSISSPLPNLNINRTVGINESVLVFLGGVIEGRILIEYVNMKEFRILFKSSVIQLIGFRILLNSTVIQFVDFRILLNSTVIQH